MKKRIVGLTGIPGSGKSTVARMLQAKGACVIDMDAVGHWVLEHDAAVREGLRREFGEAIFDEEGKVLRPVLAEIVFSDPQALEKLNALVHPAMLKRAQELVEEAQKESCPFIVVEAALLCELGFHNRCDLVLFVDAPVEECLQRLEKQRGLWREQALARMNAQWPREQKLAYADDVLINNGLTEELRGRVESWLSFRKLIP